MPVRTSFSRAWHPAGGTFMAKVGSTRLDSPGMTVPIHTHSGMEAFYTLTGETCLESSKGVQTGHGPGHVNMIAGGLPMLLMATGNETRRGVVLIIHNISMPATTLDPDWKPKGLCTK